MKNKLILIDVDGTSKSLHLNGQVISHSDHPEGQRAVRNASVALQKALSVNPVFIRIDGPRFGFKPAEYLLEHESLDQHVSDGTTDITKLQWAGHSGNERSPLFSLKYPDGRPVHDVVYRIIEEEEGQAIGAVCQEDSLAPMAFELACAAPQLTAALKSLFELSLSCISDEMTLHYGNAEFERIHKDYAQAIRVAVEAEQLVDGLNWSVSLDIPQCYLEQPGVSDFAQVEISDGMLCVAVLQSTSNLLSSDLNRKAAIVANAPRMVKHVLKLVELFQGFVDEDERAEDVLSDYIAETQHEIRTLVMIEKE